MAGTAFTVFVIDNDPTSLNRLTKVLRPTGHKIKKYPNPNTFLDEHDWTEPGCLLLNLYMKDLNGLQVQQRLAGQQLERPIIFLAARCTVEAAVKAIKAGAIDFLRKPVDRCRLFNAIERAKERDTRIRRVNAERKEITALEQRLSPREKEVLCHVIAGYQNPQIACVLEISVKTVKVHRGRVMEKMRARSVAELVRMAAKIALQPAELPDWVVQTVKAERRLAKNTPQSRRRRPMVAQSANSHSDFANLPSALHNGNSHSLADRQRRGYGPVIGLSSIRSTVS
jgi:FixJ family two-component response regulator